MRELGLKPGGRIDPATLMQDPEMAKLIAQVSEKEKQRQKIDWAGLCRYRAANAEQRGKDAPDVVFLGDSITDNWIYGDPSLFSAKVLDRGISGQTSAQILLRFQADVIRLRPGTVHIMAGTNDILQDLGPTSDDAIIDNFVAMLDLAQVHKINVVIASILPISERSWQPQLKPGPRVVRLNQRLKALALSRKAKFLDYYSVLKDADGRLRTDLGNDGVHPNRTGYAAMAPLARSVIVAASNR
ncbi:hypothetical protein V474_03325 [Novosphingobium barchaimii LL02]|uniref:SGNH hydrolase-type esterase domain-containing protein n=2 Tax=Novosphingobium barchaimii TaxID=1420591 RepID=A0A0J8A8L9_9SPHN|nr:hypothetical protein V474_03325 [Novosphingobium barchaimii LL02]